jgi:hypothetical protein
MVETHQTNPKPNAWTPNIKHLTPNPKPHTPNPWPETRNPNAGRERFDDEAAVDHQPIVPRARRVRPGPADHAGRGKPPDPSTPQLFSIVLNYT